MTEKHKTGEDVVLKGSYCTHDISYQVWAYLCKKFNVPLDFQPTYLSNGAEQVVYEFGPNHVLKVSDRDFIIKSAKKLRGRKIMGVARCFSVVKAHPNNSYYCIVQERCKVGEGAHGGNACYDFMQDLSHAFTVLKGRDVKLIESAIKLKKLGLQSVVDFQNANAMVSGDNKIVVSDYGCLRF